jgi:molecular chaperone GrpE
MTKSEPRIQPPTPDDVARYAGSAASGSPPSDAATGQPPGVDAVQRLRDELKDANDRQRRALAEVQNVTRRLNDERSQALRFALADFVRDLLPVLDNFERTMSSMTERHEDDAVIQGVKLIYEMLQKTLESHHVRSIESVGKPFDPNMHEALRREETSDQPDGAVIAELQRGYTLFERVLRPSRVVVAARPAAPAPDAPGSAA